MQKKSSDIAKLYQTRFNSLERVQKSELWQILCKEFLQKFIKSSDIVLDIGAGHCEFINNIRSSKKIALDINTDFVKFAGKDVKTIIGPIKNLNRTISAQSVDVIFMSNFLEHLDSK